MTRRREKKERNTMSNRPSRKVSQPSETLSPALAHLFPSPETIAGTIPPGHRGKPKSCTLGQWLYWFLSVDAAPHWADSTLYGCAGIARHHILPAIGALRLGSLTALRLQTYLAGKLGEGLSPNTVLKHYTLLFTALRRAEEYGIVKGNPMRAVVPPRSVPPRYTFYSPQQLRILFRAAEDTLLELPIKLAAYLGLRRGEIAGLRWQCVDFSAKTLLIQETRTEVGGVVVLKQPKTRNSVRQLGIGGSPDLLALLERTWARRRSNNPAEYVLLKADGTPPTPNYLTEALLVLVRENRLPPITLHGLRHSFASVANSEGIPMHDISKALGHSSIAVTSGIYTHLFDETESRSFQAVARAILE